MIKKNLFITFIFLVSIFGVVSQRNIQLSRIYEYGDDIYNLEIFDSTRFEIYKVLRYPEVTPTANGKGGHATSMELQVYSSGTVIIKKNKMTCYDPVLKRFYTFVHLNDSILIATKHTALFAKNDTLKLYKYPAWVNK